jgi:type II secretory pathway pseudopilin PulG
MSSRKGGARYAELIHGESSGFTIVELLIATAVFATVLVLITSGIIQVTDTFFKGENEASTQRVASNVLDTIAQAIQFQSGYAYQTSNDIICTGSEEFSYWPGYELEAHPGSGYQSATALVENNSGCTSATPSPSGRELLTDNMRLSNITLTCLSSASLCNSTTTAGALWRIEVRVVYGDDNLLYSPSGISPAAKASDAACAGKDSGEQFCAVSDISTIVSKRI